MNARRIIACLALVAAGASAQERPTTRVLDCTTAGCHASETGHRYLHGPVAVSACDTCHEYADEARHAFVLKRQGHALCDFCHIDKTGREGPVVHDPVAKGDCTACHDPHGSAARALLRRPTTRQMCLTCHEDAMAGLHSHRPADQDCTQCHRPHTATHAGLLTTDRRSLCLGCHQDVGRALEQSPHPHQPATGDCLECHAAHAADHPGVLRRSPRDLCLQCHGEVSVVMASASRGHSPTDDGRACLNCHTAHESRHVKQLHADPVASCLECHSAPVRTPEGRVVAAAPEAGDPRLFRHGPVGDGDCAACHTVHGGSLPALLAAAYETDFYRAYSDRAFALCFSCHDRSLVTAQPTATQTRFRDGERNLHAVHVAKSPQGRACRACHTVHASRHEGLIAESVPFGQWRLPINFVKTERGGSCGPGCHKPESYDRGPDPASPPPAAARRPR